jgi:gamma-glutamylcyclotransferase (GGCT)/AIG2-like uncharacterized protein YtfP
VIGLARTAHEVTKEDLDRLDELEGYPTAYRRFQADVETSNGQQSCVWVYEVVDKQGPMAPTREYLGIVKDAAERLAFPEAYRSLLNRIETSP